MGTPTKGQLRKYFDDLAAAYEKLSKIKSATIRNIYNNYSKELLILCPNFKYPEWEYITVGTFLKEMEEGDIDLGEDEDV
jgi:hypothetical protein